MHGQALSVQQPYHAAICHMLRMSQTYVIAKLSLFWPNMNLPNVQMPRLREEKKRPRFAAST